MFRHALRSTLSRTAARPAQTRALYNQAIPAIRKGPNMRKGGLDPAVFSLTDGLRAVRALASAHFVETVDLVVNTNLDTKKPDQQLRGVCQLPHGTGQKVSVAVFAQGPAAEAAKAAGATFVGGQDLADDIKSGKVKVTFNRCVATADMMPVVAQIARVLGPRGLMPNPKTGTLVSPDPTVVADSVANALKGEVQFKAEKAGVIHAAVGNVNFTVEQLQENVEALVASLAANKPDGAKQHWYKSAFVSSTQGRSVRLDIKAAPFKPTKK
jgi:large subunit ribosomal protein L1